MSRHLLRRVRARALWATSLGLALGCSFPSPMDQAAEQCLGDLRTSFGLIERNYAGYAYKRERLGEDAIAQAQARALAELAARGPARCDAILRAWIAVLEDPSLGVQDVPASATPDVAAAPPMTYAPEFEVLSPQATWIRVPSFAPDLRDALEQLLGRHRASILAHPELVIDVRGNAGGAQATYTALAELFYTTPVRTVGADVLATPENADAWERFAPRLHPSDRGLYQTMVDKMRARPGEWVELVADATATRSAVLARPARVALLVDRRCAGACEEFLYEARQSSKVRLFGEPTRGAQALSEVRPHVLPSGRALLIPSVRTHRLLETAPNGLGITPDSVIEPDLFDGPTRSRTLGRVLDELRAALPDAAP